jgi:hypothetical protein
LPESSENYRAHAGYVLFPRTSVDLTDTTRCPACYIPLDAIVCATCGLDLSSGLAIHLAQASTDAAAALDRRLNLIGRMRFESASIPQTVSPNDAAPNALPVESTLLTPTPPRRPVSVQLVLLLVGVALLSVGAIFFLVYASIGLGLVWRSLIIATVTVAAYVGATSLQRRQRTATAESVTVPGVVLTYLDIFALRANDLLIIGDSSGFAY